MDAETALVSFVIVHYFGSTYSGTAVGSRLAGRARHAPGVREAHTSVP